MAGGDQFAAGIHLESEARYEPDRCVALAV
jgi:hypothetical protein